MIQNGRWVEFVCPTSWSDLIIPPHGTSSMIRSHTIRLSQVHGNRVLCIGITQNMTY